MSKRWKVWLSVLLGVLSLMALCGVLAACGETEGQAHEHTYEWVTRSPATCTAGGTETQQCTVCGRTGETREVAPLAHTYKWVKLSESTCTVKGIEKEVCSVCGAEGETRESDLADHTPGTEKGHDAQSHYTVCTVCGGKTDVEPHTGSGNYLSDGNVHYRTCSVCGERTDVGSHVAPEGAEIDATSHNFDCTVCSAHVEGEHFTLSANGYYEGEGVCADCGYAIYSFHNGVINLYRGSYTKLKLPATIGGEPVTAIGSNAFLKSAVTEVELSDTIALVGEDAFANCTSLTRIQGGSGLTTLGKTAFRGCTHLSTVTLKELNEIGEGTFEGCTALRQIEMPASLTTIGRDAFSGTTVSVKWAEYPAIREIGTAAFRGWLGTSFTFPASVSVIGDRAFDSCTELPLINVPDSVIEIGSSAFEGCSSMQAAILGYGVTGYLVSTFKGCTVLSNVTVYGNIQMLQDTFNGCSGLQSVFLYGTSLELMHEGTFAGCTSLDGVYLNNDLSRMMSIVRNHVFDLEVLHKVYLYYEEDPYNGTTLDGMMFKAWHYDGGGNVVVWESHSPTASAEE